MLSRRGIDSFAIGLATLPLLAAVLLWPELPAEMAVHWSGGQPDSYIAKPVATVGLYGLAVGSVVFVRLAPDSFTSTPGGEDLTVLFLGVIFAGVQGLVLAWNLGFRFSVELAVVPILVLTGLLLAVAYWLG